MGVLGADVLHHVCGVLQKVVGGKLLVFVARQKCLHNALFRKAEAFELKNKQ